MIGRVYKIIVNCSNDIYVGSTLQECRRRWQEHKANYRSWLNNVCKTKTTSFELFEKYGIDNCKIILIREYQVVDKEHLKVYEQLWINKLKPINKVNPLVLSFLIKRQYPKYNKENYKRRIQLHPNYNKENYQERIQRHPNYLKKRYETLLTKNPNYNREFYEKYREKKTEKITCDCGIITLRSNLSQHKKTKKHLQLMEQQQNQ